MARRYKYRPPITQYVASGGRGWRICRQPGVEHSYWVLYGVELVGWVFPTSDGWRWGYAGVAGVRPSRSSKGIYGSCERATAALSRTSYANRISGGVTVRASAFRPVQTERALWTPKPERD